MENFKALLRGMVLNAYQRKLAENEFVDEVYNLHLQNISGRETPEAAFKYGIEASFEEILDNLQVKRFFTLDEFAAAYKAAAKKTTTVDDPQDFEDYVLDIISEANKTLRDGTK